MTENIAGNRNKPASCARIHALQYPLHESSPCSQAGLTAFRSFYYQLAEPIRRLELPSAKVMLVIGIGDDVCMAPSGSTDTPQRFASFAVGPCHAPLVTELHGTRSCIEIELPPWAAYECFGHAGITLDTAPVPLDSLLGPCVQMIICRQLSKCPSWPERFALMEEFLARWIHARSRIARSEIRWAWERIETSGGRIPIGELSRELGWSHRHFVHCFRDTTGLAPKTAARLIRLARASRLLQESDGDDLCLVAAHCGYSDQAHLTREFRTLAGCTPAGYRDLVRASAIEVEIDIIS